MSEDQDVRTHLRSVPLAVRIVGALLALANAVAVLGLFLNAVELTETYERAVLLLLFMLEGFGAAGIYGGVLLYGGRRLGLWLALVSLPVQTALNLFVGFPTLQTWWPAVLLGVVVVVAGACWRRLR